MQKNFGNINNSRGAISLVNSMTKSLEEGSETQKIVELNRYIHKFQDVIKKGLDGEKFKKQSERNIFSWYKFNDRSYSSDKYKINAGKKQLIDSFKNDDYYIFKNIVERIGRELIVKLFQKELEKNYDLEAEVGVKTYITSDSDDVFGGVDLIVELNEDGQESYLGIDIAVSDDSNYLEAKTEKETSKCLEYNLFKGLPTNTYIKRVVLDFERKVMANFLLEFFKTIEAKGVVNIKLLYNKHYKSKHDINNEHKGLGLSDLITNTGKNVDRILTIKN